MYDQPNDLPAPSEPGLPVESRQVERGRAGVPNAFLIAALSSLVTCVVMLVLAPALVYPRVADLLRPELKKVERQIAQLQSSGAGSAVRYVASPDMGWLAPSSDASGLPPVTAVTLASEKVGPAVVGIIAGSDSEEAGNGRFHNGSFGQQSSGSGLIFDSRGYIVTNHHVVDGARSIDVILADGRRLAARVVGADPRTDLAVLKVEASNLPVAELGDSDKVRIGDLAVAIGNPVSMEFQRTVTAGVISGLGRSLRVTPNNAIEVIQTDAAISPGNSGGPLANALGQVIGINTAKMSLPDVEGMGFAVPINTVKRVAAELIQSGKVTRPWLGVGILEQDEAAQRGISFDHGVMVYEVVPNGPAAVAGIRVRDIILAVDGKATDSYLTLRKLLEAKRVGQRVELRVRRGEQELTIGVVLGQMPE